MTGLTRIMVYHKRASIQAHDANYGRSTYAHISDSASEE
jgi:hypothetical protein